MVPNELFFFVYTSLLEKLKIVLNESWYLLISNLSI